MGTRTPTPEFQSPHGTAWESHQSAAQWWNRRPTVLEPLRSEELKHWDIREGTRGLISFSTVYKEAGSQILLGCLTFVGKIAFHLKSTFSMNCNRKLVFELVHVMLDHVKWTNPFFH